MSVLSNLNLTESVTLNNYCTDIQNGTAKIICVSKSCATCVEKIVHLT